MGDFDQDPQLAPDVQLPPSSASDAAPDEHDAPAAAPALGPGGGDTDAMVQAFGHYADDVDPASAVAASGGSIFPPWGIPGTDWAANPPAPKLSTDDARDTPQNQDRLGQQRADDPRGNGAMGPVDWWSSKPLDLTKPDNPFTPEAQARIKEAEQAEAQRRAAETRAREQERQRMLDAARQMREPDQPGDHPLPSGDPGMA